MALVLTARAALPSEEPAEVATLRIPTVSKVLHVTDLDFTFGYEVEA